VYCAVEKAACTTLKMLLRSLKGLPDAGTYTKGAPHAALGAQVPAGRTTAAPASTPRGKPGASRGTPSHPSALRPPLPTLSLSSSLSLPSPLLSALSPLSPPLPQHPPRPRKGGQGHTHGMPSPSLNPLSLSLLSAPPSLSPPPSLSLPCTSPPPSPNWPPSLPSFCSLPSDRLPLPSAPCRWQRRDFFKFTFVRNPFGRILSAYLDKHDMGSTLGRSRGDLSKGGGRMQGRAAWNKVRAYPLCHCQSVNLSPCHPVTLSLCHSVTLSLCHSVTLSPCHSVTLSLCHSVTLSLCHSVTLSPCHSVTLSLALCHSVTLSLTHTHNLTPTNAPTRVLTPAPSQSSLPLQHMHLCGDNGSGQAEQLGVAGHRELLTGCSVTLLCFIPPGPSPCALQHMFGSIFVETMAVDKLSNLGWQGLPWAQRLSFRQFVHLAALTAQYKHANGLATGPAPRQPGTVIYSTVQYCTAHQPGTAHIQ